MQRYGIRIEGIVQGVGFRPFVYHLASRLQLGGFVRNQTGAVWIEAEGDRPVLQQFLAELVRQSPPMAQVARLQWQVQPLQGERDFHIETSQCESPRQVFVSPDIATCVDCLAEVFNPLNRRFAYPLTNCSHCGPRLSIITSAPYDRVRTTMAAFPMCPACGQEFENPADRRFHAQPIACPACGPQLELFDAAGEPMMQADPLGTFAEQIRAGCIGAIKGLGGYHLVCQAEDQMAVAQLRQRKSRDEKPFAIMVRDPQTAAKFCELSAAERELLVSPRAPIVLLRKGPGCPIADAVAPHNRWLGVMLAYTPLHHLLLQALGGAALVMTSANRSDEPIVYQDHDARQRLPGIADLLLTHNRQIHVGCDDSVTRWVGGAELPLRRSRGYAPQPVSLAAESAWPTLAVGGQLKATFALARGDQAFISHHLGDLDHFGAYRAFLNDVALYEQLFSVRPQRIAHDLHPDYASTQYALQRAAAEGLELIAVQHHHAHMASCMADNSLSLSEPVIGVTFDGTGFGTDGAVWGGEFLVGDCREFRRAAQLRYVGMPGAEQAIREPWRMAASHLLDADADASLLKSQIAAVPWRTVQTMLKRRLNCPDTSSMGRLFDAIAAIAGVRLRNGYEGQAASELEWLATDAVPQRSYQANFPGSYRFDVETAAKVVSGIEPPASAGDRRPMPVGDPPLVIDTRPLIRAVVEDVRRGAGAAAVARRFHSAVVEMIVSVCGQLRQSTSVDAVVLSGGVFLNALLTIEATERLEQEGFRVYRHRQVPPGDGGLSLGQLAVAIARGNGCGLTR